MISGKTANEIEFSIKKSVTDGLLSHGQPLPTIRSLAEDLGVNRNTVAAAYRALSEQGLISGKGRQGSRINLLERKPESRAGAIRELSGGNPDPELFPDFSTMFSKSRWSQRKYGDIPDDPELVDIVAQAFREDGMPIQDVWLSSGTFDAVITIFRRFLQPGDSVAVEDPCFVTTLGLVRRCGYTPVAMPVDGNGVTPEGLENALKSGAKAVVLTPRAQNPFGGSWSSERHGQLFEIMQRYPDVILIEDDHFSVLSAFPPMTLVDPARENWAIIRSTSKYLGPDLRLAAVNSSEPVSRACQSLNAFTNRWVSGFLQSAALNVLNGPKFADFTAKVAKLYQDRRVAAIQALAAHGITAYGRDGINIWIPVTDESFIVRRLGEEGWGVRAGSVFRINSAPGIRLTTSSLTEELSNDFAGTLAMILKFDEVERGA
ncbi:MAG: GntR family transcriptional regulator [Rhodobacteraceae bacterium]|nr:GntR family transcriptional regulator [Paracoccaceae bacterium]